MKAGGDGSDALTLTLLKRFVCYSFVGFPLRLSWIFRFFHFLSFACRGVASLRNDTGTP